MTVVRRRDSLAALAAAALGLGCAAVQANRPSPGKVAQGTFTPSRPAVAEYGPAPQYLCPVGGAFPILASNAAEIAKDGGRPAPQPDGRLCAMADTLLGWKEPGTPPESVTSFLAWSFGLPAAPGRVLVATVDSEDPRILAQRMLDAVNSYAQNAVAPRFGAFTQREAKGQTRVVAVVYDAVAELDPLPRRLEVGGQAPLHVRLAKGVEKPKLSTCDPAGKLVEQPAAAGGELAADLKCGDRPGMLMVEVRAERQGQSVTAASFPIACGTPLPGSVPVPPDAKKAAAPGGERRVFDLVNAARAGAKAAPVAWDDAVAAVARAASDATRDESRANTSATTVDFDVVSQLKKRDAVSPLVLLNPAAARSPEEAQWRLAHSPLHRSNMLNPQATHAGVGLSTLKDAEGREVYFVTELLVREQPPVDAEGLRAKLRDAVARKRADARAEKLAADPLLEETAQKYASALAAAKGDLPKEQANAILAPLYKPFRTVSIVGGAKTEPLEFAEEPGVVAPAKLVGVGVAGGPNAVLGKNTAYVIILVGTRR